MNAMPASPLFRSLALAATALALAAALGGCATSGSKTGMDDAVSAGLITPDNETDARRRARTRLALAASYFENGQTAVALSELKQVLQIDPTFPDAYNLSGLIYMSLGDMPMASAQLQRALSLNPRDSNTLHNLGWMYCQQKNYEQASQMFDRAVSNPLYPERAKTLMTKGICEARAGDRTKAEATLLKAYELDPGNPITGYNLSQLLFLRGDLERARFYIRRLNNSELGNAESLWLGIKIERQLGHTEAVLQLADQLRRRYPSSSQLVSYERGRFNE